MVFYVKEKTQMLKKRALSFLMALVMVCSLLPATALAAGETDAITIQEKSVTPSTTTVTVTVTGYEGLSNATLRLSTGPEGSESDWGMSNPPRTALGSQTYTGPGTYTFSIDASILTSGNNVQAFLYYWDDGIGDWRYIYGAPVDILDGPAVPSASIISKTVTNRTTELIVTLKNLPDSGIFRVVQLDADESFDSAKLNSYTSLYFSMLSNLKAGENTLTLNSTPTAGCKLLAVIRDSSGDSMKDYVSAPVTVTYEQEPAVLSIVGTVDSSSTSVVVNLTRVPATGVLKIIALDAGEAIPDDVFNYNYTGALYTGYLFSANLKAGENTLTLNANPAAGKVLYAVMKDSDNQVYTSDGVTVAQAAVPFSLYIKGKLEQTSTELSVLPLMKSHNAVPSTLQSAVLSRKDTDTVLSRVADPKMGEVMTFSGLSGLTAGEKLTVTVTYDSGKTARQDYLVCDAAEEDSFEIVETQFTTTSTTLTVKVSGYNWYNNREDWSRICISTGSANQTKPGDDEGREDLTSQTFTGKGTYTFTIPADKMSELKEGNSIMAALRFYDGNGVEGRDDWEYYADAKTLLISGAGKTPLERLANCSVSILKDGQPRTETFKQESTTVDYAVTLDDEIPSAALSFYAYPGTVSFDPDNNHHISLGGVKVTGSGSGTVSIDLTKVPVGYRVIASLYVCIDGNEWYRHVNSAQTPEVVDEKGQGFQDYDYPDAKIDETELKAGATSLHVTLTGDQRLFDAAAAGKTTLTVAIAQYPANESFDFEGLNQIALVRNYTVKEAFSGKEFTFDTPLKAGYRVRAVVYWTQNVDLYLAPGNDYEEKFHKPDDSVLISGQPEPAVTVAAKAPITPDSSAVTFTLGGSVPAGSILLAKSYPTGTTTFATNDGTAMGTASPSGAGDCTVSLWDDVTLSVGEIVVGFLLKGGELQAQSQPVTVTEAKPAALYTVTPKSGLTPETTELTVTLTAAESAPAINALLLYRTVNGKITEYDEHVARKGNAAVGDNTLSIPADTLSAGDTLRFVVQYEYGNDFRYFEAGDITVTSEKETDSFTIAETTFTVDSTTATVNLTGYSDFAGCILRLTTGTPGSNGDADSRTTLASQTYRGSDTYIFTFDSGKLTGGNTIQAYLYRYDGSTERTYYAYSNAVAIEKAAVEPTVAIKAPITPTSKSITFTLGGSVPEGAFLLAKSYPAGTTSFATNQGTPLGNTFPSGAGDYTVSLQGGVTLSVGEIVVGFLLKGGELQAKSQPVTVTGAAEKEKPTAYLLTQKVTAGMTSLSATMRFDSSISSADYKLYQFIGDTLDTETATVLTYGSLYKSQTNYTLYMGIGRLKAGSHLQLVLTAGGEEARSAVLTVEPSPNWGTPYAAFSVSAVKSDAKSVSLTVDYADEYLSMGDDFYCDVTVYACPGEYTDDEIKDSDLWENYNVCRGVAKANSRLGGETRGQLTLDFYETAGLKAGERLFIKLRLPHVEWEDEEVDYVSASIPVIAAEDEIPAYSVVLYNLDEDTSRGARLRTILSQLGIPAVEMTYENLNQSVGYLAGLDGYETASAPYSGKEYTAEFMLLCNLPEALLDRFLDAMQADGLRIDHKAVVTAYNRDTLYYELMDDIADEHSVFQMLLQLNSMVEESKKVSSGEYGQAENWDDFQKALNAGIALIRSEEPSYEDLSAAYEALKKEYLAVTGQKELAGTAVISIAEEAGGTYSMTASVAGGNADGHYAYTWANGSTEQTVTGIPAQRLIGTTVTVTAEGCYGKLTAQLAVPAYEAPAVSAGKTSVTVQLQSAEGGANTPAATQYVVSLYRGGQLVETRTVSSAESVVFSGLSSSTAYTVKSYAVSPVGRSDILTQAVTTQSGSSGSGSSGSSGSRYGVSVADSAHGDVTVTPGSARRGDTVTVTVKPDAGYELNSITVKDADGKTLRLTDKGQGRYTFTMPGSRVSVSASFKAESAELPFADVPSGSYYEDAVLWALRQGITTGTGAAAFGPDLACTRAQAVTFLWRASGSPAPKSADTAFTDVVSGSYYYDAVLWAVENGITGGTTASTFDPDGICSRAQIVAFLWRSQESPAVDGANPFTDVSGSAYYAGAVLWAASEKVTAGISEDTFAPQRSCTRAQIITFLWRALAE